MSETHRMPAPRPIATVMVGAMRGFASFLLVVGCGSAARTSPPPDAASDANAAFERPVLTEGASDAISDRLPTNRPLACGGEVEAVGLGLDGTFSATYVHVQRCDGDCPGLFITVADNATLASQSLTFVFWRGATGTYLGSQTMDVLVQRAGESTWTTLPATIELTVAEPPGLPTSLNAPAFGMIVGTFSVQAGGVDISGTFSSPVCSSSLHV